MQINIIIQRQEMRIHVPRATPVINPHIIAQQRLQGDDRRPAIRRRLVSRRTVKTQIASDFLFPVVLSARDVVPV